MFDVSFVLADPSFARPFQVKRRAETIGANGRSTLSERVIEVRGVVNASEPSKMMRRDDAQMVPRAIEVNAPFIFRGASTGYQPDIIVWQGTEYLVVEIYPFSQYGGGHSRVLAESTAGTDAPPT